MMDVSLFIVVTSSVAYTLLAFPPLLCHSPHYLIPAVCNHFPNKLLTQARVSPVFWNTKRRQQENQARQPSPYSDQVKDKYRDSIQK